MISRLPGNRRFIDVIRDALDVILAAGSRVLTSSKRYKRVKANTAEILLTVRCCQGLEVPRGMIVYRSKMQPTSSYCNTRLQFNCGIVRHPKFLTLLLSIGVICQFLSWQFPYVASVESSDRNHYEILRLSPEASAADLKRAYRKLALKYHPDKLINANLTDADIEQKKNVFLRIQEAYDVLSDHDKRIQYDMQLSGVQYDIVDIKETEENRYMRAPRFGSVGRFSLFARSSRFKLHFEAAFARPKIPDIVANIKADLHAVTNGLETTHRYYRRLVCAACGGNGGKDGKCNKCELCGGSGTAKQLFLFPTHDVEAGTDGEGDHHTGSKTYSFEHMSETTCAACDGKGCFPMGKCSACNGRGMKMEESKIFISLLPGFKNGYTVTAQGQGHQDFDGRRGDITVTILYDISEGWVYDEPSGSLSTTKTENIDNFLKDFRDEILSPTGETVSVNIPKHDELHISDIISGFNVTVPGYGLRFNSQEPKRGDLIVHYSINWESISVETYQKLLMVS